VAEAFELIRPGVVVQLGFEIVGPQVDPTYYPLDEVVLRG